MGGGGGGCIGQRPRLALAQIEIEIELRAEQSLSIFAQIRNLSQYYSPTLLQILSAFMARQSDNGVAWTDKVSTHICIFYKFFEFSRICLSLPFMPNLLSNIKILLLLPNILIRSEVSRGTDIITKINSNLIGRFIFCQYWS